jgi:transcription elongation factor Elf1
MRFHQGSTMAPRISSPRSRIYEIYFPRCPCPKCGEVLSAPAHSEFLKQRNVRHTWMCDKCDYEFETLIWLNLPPAVS